MTLRIDNLTVRFGGYTVFEKISFEIQKGETIGLIGPNGAGKTTVFNAVSGLVIPREGDIFVGGISLKKKKQEDRIRLGIARTFQQVQLFPEYTLEENLLMSCRPDHFLKFFYYAAAEKEKVRSMLLFSHFYEDRHKKLKDMPFGIRRLIQVTCSAIAEPSFLLLDEPGAGLNFQEIERLNRLLLKIQQRFGTGILMIDHNMDLVMGISEKIHVLADQKILATGTPQEIRSNELVLKAYLGDQHA